MHVRPIRGVVGPVSWQIVWCPDCESHARASMAVGLRLAGSTKLPRALTGERRASAMAETWLTCDRVAQYVLTNSCSTIIPATHHLPLPACVAHEGLHGRAPDRGRPTPSGWPGPIPQVVKNGGDRPPAGVRLRASEGAHRLEGRLIIRVPAISKLTTVLKTFPMHRAAQSPAARYREICQPRASRRQHQATTAQVPLQKALGFCVPWQFK